MRLKRVRIIGFKTFADKTEFTLEGDVTAVVGPNGCGKSNLVDAILWGLGEGNARSLRAATGQDVIFNGSPKRKAVGFAEVTLVFDNEDQSLPIDTAEVVITRRLTRGGDGDYSINKRSCRLRDIHELLADSGLGRSGYAIVGQKEIDAALAASAEERRGWVDEAAGVQRYRARKIESQRRLAQANDHLSRVGDIISEIESQRGPLREEAERAHRYKQIAQSLREVEVGLLAREAAEAIREIGDLAAKIQTSSRLAVEEAARCESLDAEAARVRAELQVKETETESLREALQEAVTTLERSESNLKLAEQRLQSLTEQEGSLDEDAATIAERIRASEHEVAANVDEENASYERLKELKAALGGASAEAKALAAELDSLEKELSEARRVEQDRLKAEAAAHQQATRRKDVERELAGIKSAIPDLEAAVQDAQTQVDEAKSVVDEIESRLAKGLEQINAIQQSSRADDQAVRDALGKKAAIEGRIRGIESTISSLEGVAQGTRAVVEAAKSGILQAEYTPVSQAIECEPDVALAIETALGGSANDLIVEQDRDAKAAIEFLKSNRAGRATFQPIPLMRPSEPSSELRRLTSERGVLGRASELVTCPSRFRPVIDSLLGRVLIVEELDDALRLARTTGWSRMVTLDGEVVHGSGAVTGGTTKNTSYGMVQRRADLADLERELGEIVRLVQQQTGRADKRNAEIAKLEAELETAKVPLPAAKAEWNDQRQYLQTLNEELQVTLKQRDRLERELGTLNGVLGDIKAGRSVAELDGLRDSVLKALAGRNADAEQSEVRLREAEQAWSKAQGNRLSAERRLKQAQEDNDLRTNRMANIGPLRDRLGKEIELHEVRIEEMQAIIGDLNRDLSEKSALKRGLSDRLGQVYDEAKSARENASAISAANQNNEILRARAESRRANSLQRLFEEYGIGETEAVELSATVEIPEDAQTLTNRFRRELRAMGDVNLGAIDAFERLTVRYDELFGQQQDILEGIGQVEAAIVELDNLTRDRFLTTFTKVQAAFRTVFQTVFPGGEGDLVLTNLDQVLDSGVDIDVRLPGKRKQVLQLLSGGERSLCAAAFLFALLRVKPSPLVILDEVDAPLDGRNVERFSALLSDFIGETQFIVITHNPTTIESAPVWLGVTMNEPGVSTLVPAKLRDAKQFVSEFANV
ncbi:Smc Chromosome segregation ATPases [Fimbriimonadaceae bacterium]